MAGRHLTEADHTKALHDALNIDADTVDGQHASAFATSGHAHSIADLDDVVVTTPANDEVLSYDTTSGDWINQTAAEAGLAASGHSHTESDISDLSHYTNTDANAAIDARVDKAFVDTLNVDADTLDGVHSSGFASVGHTHGLDDLNDVVITTVGDQDIIAYDAAELGWINQTHDEAGIVSKTGDQTISGNKTFSSAVTLPGDPTLDLHAAPKQYVDDRLNAVTNATAITEQTGITTEVDITSMSVTVDLISGEPVNIEALVPLRYAVGETASVIIKLYVSENGGAYTEIARDRKYATFISNERWVANIDHYYTPATTTSYTFKLTAQRDIGSNDFRVSGETTRSLAVYYPTVSYNYATQDYVDGEDWVTPTYNGGHAAIGGAYAVPSYKKSGNVIHLRGVMDTSGATATQYEMFTLPSGYRPVDRQIFICAARMGGTYGVTRVDVATNGNVLIQPGGGQNDHLDVLGASPAWVSISGISFTTV